MPTKIYREELKRFGMNVRAERKRVGLSQEGLAEQAGLTGNFISLIETGEGNPSLNTVFALVNALNVELVDLICGVGYFPESSDVPSIELEAGKKTI